MPESYSTCTAYIVEVCRGSAGLRYSMPVRYSRFERLHAELLSELPELRAALPPLPAKRGALDLTKLFTALNHGPGARRAAPWRLTHATSAACMLVRACSCVRARACVLVAACVLRACLLGAPHSADTPCMTLCVPPRLLPPVPLRVCCCAFAAARLPLRV